MFQLTFSPRKTALFFLAIVFTLTLLHSIALTAFFYTENQELTRITDYVDLDIERNLPSFYSALALLSSSLLFFCISSLEKKQGGKRCYWFGLGIIFFYLSIDEAFMYHEKLGDYMEQYVQATGLYYFPWIIPYSVLTLILGVLYFRFILNLPRKTTILLFFSAAIFLTGATVFDMLGGKEAELNGYYTITYTVLYTIEEFLEMSGVVLLIYTLLDYIEQRFGRLCLSLQAQQV